METAVLERIRQTNPWLFGQGGLGLQGPSAPPVPFVPRRQVTVEDLLKPGKAHLVVGPRQAGKSSLVWSALRRLRMPLYVNLEEPVFRAWCSSPASFMEDVGKLGPSLDALFLEEAQWLPEASLFVKGVVDLRPAFPIIVTGSSSFELRDRVRESLAGRATRHLLLPFSLAEVTASLGTPGTTVFEAHRREAIRAQLRIGGYPEVWLGQTPERTLGDLVHAFVLRDASDLFRVERLDAYQKLMRLAAMQVGNLVNQSELASIASVSVNTVARYLSIMEEAHLIRLVLPFASGKRRELKGAPKVYFLDNGLRNAVLNRAGRPVEGEPDEGALIENWVFGELSKMLPWSQPVRYWRSLSGAEVDLVVDAPSNLLGIEVKSRALRLPTVSRSSRSFIRACRPGEFWVLNDALDLEGEAEGVRVRFIPFHRLPEDLARWRVRAGLER